LKEQSGGELVTSEGILYTHWLAAAIEKKEHKYYYTYSIKLQ
jgi:hypothetical protein